MREVYHSYFRIVKAVVTNGGRGVSWEVITKKNHQHDLFWSQNGGPLVHPQLAGFLVKMPFWGYLVGPILQYSDILGLLVNGYISIILHLYPHIKPPLYPHQIPMAWRQRPVLFKVRSIRVRQEEPQPCQSIGAQLILKTSPFGWPQICVQRKFQRKTVVSGIWNWAMNLY